MQTPSPKTAAPRKSPRLRLPGDEIRRLGGMAGEEYLAELRKIAYDVRKDASGRFLVNPETRAKIIQWFLERGWPELNQGPSQESGAALALRESISIRILAIITDPKKREAVARLTEEIGAGALCISSENTREIEPERTDAEQP